MKILSCKLLIFAFLITGCGFKVLDNSAVNNFSINKIETSGEKRINYKIKNYLLSNTVKNGKEKIILNIISKKNKTIKDKNIKNEITKYSIEIITKVNIDKIETNFKKSFNVTVKGDFLVAGNYIKTLANEKNKIDNLVEEISEEIVRKIGEIMNDI